MTVILTSQLKAINENTVHRYATLWLLRRSDGTVLRFTDHNTDITFGNSTYESAIGFQVSATQRSSGLSESNKEGVGLIVPVGVSGITENDLRGGKYRNAIITERLVDWQYPWIEDPIYETKYILSDIVYDGFAWKAELMGQAKFLRLPVGKIYTKNCRHLLGASSHFISAAGLAMFESRCEFDLDVTPLTAAYNSVAAKVTTTVTAINNARKIFSVDRTQVTSSYLVDVFRYGIVKFTSGLNSGLEFEVSKSVAATGSVDSEITTFVDVPYNIAVSDAVTLTVGCDKTIATCKGKFANNENYGGFPDIPNADRAMFVPDRKT